MGSQNGRGEQGNKITGFHGGMMRGELASAFIQVTRPISENPSPQYWIFSVYTRLCVGKNID
jgi:hypothetical protein